jgi:DNA-binding HxlR family transcriptional regulator
MGKRATETPSDGEGHVCPAEVTVVVVGGRWKLLILWHLFQGPARFSELARSIPRISQKMLTQQLREMETHGVIRRTVYPEVPPRVVYDITPLGRSLRPVIKAMCDWGGKHADQVRGA